MFNFNLNNQYRTNKKLTISKGETTKLNKEIVGKLLGGTKGSINETTNRKATIKLIQYIILLISPNFFCKPICC